MTQAERVALIRDAVAMTGHPAERDAESEDGSEHYFYWYDGPRYACIVADGGQDEPGIMAMTSDRGSDQSGSQVWEVADDRTSVITALIRALGFVGRSFSCTEEHAPA